MTLILTMSTQLRTNPIVRSALLLLLSIPTLSALAADQDPLDKDNPAAPQNRRISIVLLRDAKEPPTITITPRSAKNEVPIVAPLEAAPAH